VLRGQPQTSAGPCDELRTEFEEAKEELFDLCMEMRSRGAFKTMSWEDIQNLRLTSHLAAQVKPKPDDAMWYNNLRHTKLYLRYLCWTCLRIFLVSPAGADTSDIGPSTIFKAHTHSVWDL
jgi:hypothetical protein